MKKPVVLVVMDGVGESSEELGNMVIKATTPTLDELKAIFDVTGGTARIEDVERFSRIKAEQMGLTSEEYERLAFTYNSNTHGNE